MKRIITLLLIAALCLSFSACKKQAEEEHDSVVMKTEHFTLTEDVFQYYMNLAVVSFYNANYAYIDRLGLDLSRPLKEQKCETQADGDHTWFDFFVSSAAAAARDDLVMAEYACSEGMSLDEDDEKKTETLIAEIRSGASDAGLDTGEYLRKNYGALVTEDSVHEACELHYLALKGKAAVSASQPRTDGELEKYCADNYSSFYGADYMTLTIEAGDEFDNAGTEEERDAAYKKAYSAAIGINNSVYDRASFEAEAEKYYRSVYDVKADGEQISDEQINESELSHMVSECAHIGAPYSYMDSIDAFIFSAERSPGEHYIHEDRETGRITLYFMLEPLHRDEEDCVSFRYIFMSGKTHGDNLEKDIYEAYNTWAAAGADEDLFVSVAGRYSEDATATDGGLAEFVGRDGMGSELAGWCFDPERKRGDTEVIMTDAGAYFIYFLNYHEVKWKAEAAKTLDDAAYEEKMNELHGKYEIDVHEDVLRSLPELLG